MESPLPSYNPDPQAPLMTPQSLIRPPSPRRQNWGAVISMIIIVLMIVMGAFYAWGKRIAEQRVMLQEASSTGY